MTSGGISPHLYQLGDGVFPLVSYAGEVPHTGGNGSYAGYSVKIVLDACHDRDVACIKLDGISGTIRQIGRWFYPL